jgi:hypothetical protein
VTVEELDQVWTNNSKETFIDGKSKKLNVTRWFFKDGAMMSMKYMEITFLRLDMRSKNQCKTLHEEQVIFGFTYDA